MVSKPKTSRHEYSSETISAIFKLKKIGQLHNEIAYHFKIPKSSITTINYHKVRQLKHFVQPNKRPSCPPKLGTQARHVIIYHVEKFLPINLYALSTLFKSGYNIHWTTIQKYLKALDYFCYKARKKLFLSSKYKVAKLKWAKKHLQ